MKPAVVTDLPGYLYSVCRPLVPSSTEVPRVTSIGRRREAPLSALVPEGEEGAAFKAAYKAWRRQLVGAR